MGFALKSFKDEVLNRHVKILSDNTTAVSYINNMGGCKSDDCNEMAKTIWSWFIENNIWISCTHIPGRSNVEADKKSRNFNDQLEWKLNEYVFRNIVSHWGKPNIDLFASSRKLLFLETRSLCPACKCFVTKLGKL